ncbi:MAG TPA: hypothetical protein VGI81_12370 [Tepidisphaeraceae bacterium]|jgi:hypothetical protein
MSTIHRFGSVGLLAGLLSSGALAAAQPEAPATQPSQQELIDQLKALQSEVKDLRGQLNAQQRQIQQQQQRATAATTQPAGVATGGATTADLLQDINHRQTLEINPLTGVWDPGKGFVIRSEDGAFLLHPWAFIQIRGVANYRENNGLTGTGSSSTDAGLELPRMKLILDGNMFSTDFTYQFIWATTTEGSAAPTGGSLFLQDAWGRYHLPNTPFAIRAGNIRDPLDHEQILFGTRSLTPERSIVNNVLLGGDNIVKGVTFSFGYDRPTPNGDYSPVRVEAGYTNGMRNTDTNFQGFPTNPATWGAAGRVDWKLFGRWIDYTQFTALDDKEPLLVIGAGGDVTAAGNTNQWTGVADVQFNTPNAITLYAAYMGQYTTNNAGAPGTNGGSTTKGVFPDTYTSTFRFQGAYMFGRHFEPFGRYEYIHFDNLQLPKGAPHDVIQDITVGFNYYFVGHRAKISCAASYLPDGSPIANTQSDLLVSGRNQVIVQAQFQLMI